MIVTLLEKGKFLRINRSLLHAVYRSPIELYVFREGLQLYMMAKNLHFRHMDSHGSRVTYCINEEVGLRSCTDFISVLCIATVVTNFNS